MGTDISGVVEKRGDDNDWHLVYVLRTTDRAGFRNYRQFGALAGVRSPGPDPRGLPDDMSDATRYLWDRDGGHSPSWMTVREAVNRLSSRERYATEPPFPAMDEWNDVAEFWFGDGMIDPDDRFVFWFDS